MKSKSKTVTIVLVIFFQLFFRNNSSESQGTWTKSTCTKKVLSRVQLPSDERFNGAVVDVVDGVFGPSLYFKNSSSCDYFFGIPLKFSIFSLTYLDGYFYAIRDDVSQTSSTLHRISDYDLIGGYVYWLEKSLEQCETCDPPDRPIFFDFNNYQETCDSEVEFGIYNQSQNSICSFDLDILFAKERLFLPIESVRVNGVKKYGNFSDKFKQLYRNELLNDFQSTAWRWTSWTAYSSSPSFFTSVHATEADSLFVIEPSYEVMRIDDFNNAPTTIATTSGPTRFTAIAAFDYAHSTKLVGLDIDGSVHLVQDKIKIKVGRFPHVFKKLFVIDGLTLLGLDVFDDLYTSTDYINDVLLPFSPCGKNMYRNGKCPVFVSIALPFTSKRAEENCEMKNAKYVEGAALNVASQIPPAYMFVRKLDPTTLTYDIGKQFCLDQGAQLCRHSDICPGSRPLITDVLQGNKWVPIRDNYNDWVQIGDHHDPTCLQHNIDWNPPTWGITAGSADHLKGYVFCCRNDSANEKNNEGASSFVGQNAKITHCSDSLWNLFRQEITKIVCLSDCPTDQDIWGTDVYDNPSKTCLAARHSGQLTINGGRLKVYRQIGWIELTGSTQNGVVSQSKTVSSSYTFDPSLLRASQSCASPFNENFARRCGPRSGTTAASCWRIAGCCVVDVENFLTCSHNLPAGPQFTADRWLKSPYSSYEYAIIYSRRMNFQAAREKCQHFDGEVAYASLFEKDSWDYVASNILEDVTDYIWLGLTDPFQNGSFLSLNQQKPNYIAWEPRQPDGLNRMQFCSIIISTTIYDASCNLDLDEVLCQRTAYRCNLAVESRQPCADDVPFKASRTTCLDRGCCYVEPVDGSDACFRPNNFEGSVSMISSPCSWWQSTFNNLDYCVIAINGNEELARLKCIEQGGVLAYEGINDQVTYQSLYNDLISTSSHSAYWLGFYRNGQKFFNVKGEELSWLNFKSSEPSSINEKCFRICTLTGQWCDTTCSRTVAAAVCQRTRDEVYSNGEATILCEKDVELCSVFGSTCPPNSTCIEVEDTFQCECDEGYVKQGQVVIASLDSCKISQVSILISKRIACGAPRFLSRSTLRTNAVVDTSTNDDNDEQSDKAAYDVTNAIICLPIKTCPKDWSDHPRSCLLAKVGVASFYEAEQDCQWQGGHLVSVHSDDELQQVKELVNQYSSSGMLFWIGLRRSLPWSSRNGEESDGCGLWTDGTDCDFNVLLEDDELYECYAFDGNFWSEQMCAQSLPLLRDTQVTGYICKIARSIESVSFTLTSLSWEFYPGAAQVLVDGIDVLQNDTSVYAPVSKEETGAIYIVTFASNGAKFNAIRITSSEDIQDKLTSPGTFMKSEDEKYFAIITAGRFRIGLWKKIVNFLADYGILFNIPDFDTESKEKSVNTQDFGESELDSRSSIFACNKCDESCDDVALFGNHTTSEKICRFYSDGNTTSAYQVQSERSGSTSRALIRHRSVTVKDPRTSSITCPWQTVSIKTFGINLHYFEKENFTSYANCLFPPCVHQVGCESTSTANKNEPDYAITSGFLIFCEKLSEKIYDCPVNKSGAYVNGALQSTVIVRSNYETPFLATFDDLLQLGSPPFEFGSIYGKKIPWSPAQWTWLSDNYGALVEGVHNKAIRFSESISAYTTNKFCYSTLGSSDSCSSGLTVSLWIRVIKWPTKEHQVILDTGGWGYSDECEGISIYLDVDSNDVVILIRANDTAKFYAQEVVLSKWTHIWFSWNRAAKNLTSKVDWSEKSFVEKSSSLQFFSSANSAACDRSRLTIGSQYSTGGTFDLDDLKIFERIMSENISLMIMLDSFLPIRYLFFNDGVSPPDSGTCSRKAEYVFCQNFRNNCIGSLINCKKGFNLAFTVKLPDVTNKVLINKNVMLISNLPHEVQYSDTSRLSFGFRVFAKAVDKYFWEIVVENYVDTNFRKENSVNWRVHRNVEYPVWIQFHPDGHWLFCIIRPTTCKRAFGRSYNDFDDDWEPKETFYDLQIGPTRIQYSGNSYTTSTQNEVLLFNVWFIEDAFDMVMFSDEVSRTTLPNQWRAYENGLLTKQGQGFKIQGDPSRISFSNKGSIGQHISLSNNHDDIESLLESGHKLDTVVGWLEITPETFKSESCLFDVNQCQNGFTIQFWLKVHECETLVSGGDCFYLSSGGQSYPVSNGFAFFYSSSDELYHALVAKSGLVKEIKFSANLGNDFSLVRIISSPYSGLNLLLNDIPIEETHYNISRFTMATSDYDFVPPHPISIGKRNDLLQGFSSFEIVNFQFWDKEVYGMPFQSLAVSCPIPWHQIGESCYLKVDEQVKADEAERACRNLGSELAHVPSLAAYDAFKRFIFNTGDDIDTYWIGAKTTKGKEINIIWYSIQLQLSTWNFNGFSSIGRNPSTLGEDAYGRTITSKQRKEISFENYKSLSRADGYICATPLARNAFLQGCIEPASDRNKFRIDDVQDTELHRYLSRNSHYLSNAIGSYNIPTACRRMCYSIQNSTLSVVSAHQCYCLSKEVRLSQFQTESTTLVDARQCAASNYIAQADNLQYGFQTLNFKQKSDEDLHLRSQYCGSIDSGGVFKCGTGDGNRTSVYGFSDLEYESRSSAPMEDLTLTVFSEVVDQSISTKTIEIYQEIPFVVSYPFCKAPCFLSPNDEAICNCSNSPIWFMIDFGDGSEYESYLFEFRKDGIEFAHYYNSIGTYQLVFQARSSQFKLQSKKLSFQVDEYEKVEIKSLTANASLVETEVEIEVSFYFGINFECFISYGDGTPVEKKVSQLPRFLHPFRHIYLEAGIYSLSVTCRNYEQSRSIGAKVVIQTGLAGLRAPVDSRISSKEVYEHQWDLLQGSHGICKVFIKNTSLIKQSSLPNPSDVGSFFFDRDSNQGVALVSIPPNEKYGLYTVTVVCYNTLTATLPVAVTYLLFEAPVQDIELKFIDNKVYKENEDIPLSLRVDSGSNFLIRWRWKSDKNGYEQANELCDNESCKLKLPCLTYDQEDDYVLHADIINVFGMHQSNITIHVERPIKTMNAQVASNVYPNVPIEVMNQFEENFVKGYLMIDYGDDSKVEFYLKFNESSPTLTLFHEYKKLGIYEIYFSLFNNVSMFNYSTNTQIGVDIEDIILSFASVRMLRTEEDELVVYSMLTQGSDPAYKLDFGDKSPIQTFGQNSTRVGPNSPDIHYFSHIYEIPGNYVVSMSVENIFGEKFVESSEAAIVQNPLGHKFILKPRRIETISYPPGSVTFDSYLAKSDSSSSEEVPTAGYANNVHVKWFQVKFGTKNLLWESYGHYEIDLFPLNWSFELEDIGDIMVLADMSNLVSAMTLTYKFTLVEVVENLLVKIEHHDVQTNLKNEIINVATSEKLLFIMSFKAGSHLEFAIDYGDGKSDSFISNDLRTTITTFEHQYDIEGIFSIEIVGVNNVSVINQTFDDAINVFELVGNIKSTIQSVRFEQEDVVDVFGDSSELLATIFGTDIVSRDMVYYMAVNRPISICVGTLNGSRVSITWDFSTANLTLVAESSTNVKIKNDLGSDSSFSAVETTDNGVVKIKVLKQLTSDELADYKSFLTSKLDTNEYKIKTWLLVQFMTIDHHVIHVETSNRISSVVTSFNLSIQVPPNGVEFLPFNPPVANKTVNISITAAQLGTSSCYVIDPGDYSYKIGFGSDPVYCIDEGGVDPEFFYALTQDLNDYSGKKFSFYKTNGNLKKGDSQFNFTFQHVYYNPIQFTIKLLAFNRISRLEKQTTFNVVENLCEYPVVKVEKYSKNSVEFPRVIPSFLNFRLYTNIKINCKITTLTYINWYAYEMVKIEKNIFGLDQPLASADDTNDYVTLPNSAEKFSSPFYKFKSVPGLSYTSKSEDITFPPRFLKLGLHLICINVAMFNVPGLNSSDCIYINNVLPPLVAGINYGVRRSVRHGDVIVMDAFSASYDPDIQTFADVQSPTYDASSSNLMFRMSCPFVVKKDSADQVSFDEKLLMFEGNSELLEFSFCNEIEIKCQNSLRVIKLVRGNFTVSFNNIYPSNSSNISNVSTMFCSGLNSCNMLSNTWLNEIITQFGFNLTNVTVSSCVQLQYQCVVPEFQNDFVYIEPKNTCLNSGYYSLKQSNSRPACSAIMSVDEKTCGKLEINSTQLFSNQSYMVRVLVIGSNDRLAVSSQVLEFFTVEPPKLRINCHINCNLKINPNRSIVLNATQIDVMGNVISHNPRITFSWLVFEAINETKAKRSLSENDDDLLLVENYEGYAATGIHDKYFVLEPGLLQPSIQYRIRVVGVVDGARGFTETELSVNLPPYGGDCSITPDEGIALNDTFTVTCSGWKDEGINAERPIYISRSEYTLGYEISCRTDEESPPKVLFYGSSEEVSDLYLPPGLKENDYIVWIQVKIIDEYRALATVNLTARVYEPMTLSEEMLEENTLAQVATSNSQNLARIVAATFGYLNNKNSTVTVNSTDSENKTWSETAFRRKLVDAVVEKINPDASLDGLKQSSGAMDSLTAVADKTDDEVQTAVADSLNNGTQRLLKLSETSSSEDIKETSSIMVGGIRNVVQAARAQVLKDASTVDSHSSLAPLPIFSLQEEPETSPNDITDPEEEYLSPEERVEKRNKKRKLKMENHSKTSNQTKKIGMSAISSVTLMTDSLIKRKAPGEPVVEVKTNGVKLEAQRNSASQLCEMLSQNKTINKTASTLASLFLGSNVDFSDCNATSAEESVDAVFANFDDNPFLWDDSADNVRSSVVSLTFKFENGTKPFQGSNNTFRIEVPVSKSLSNISPQTFEFVNSGEDSMSYHEITFNNYDDVIFLTVTPIVNNLNEDIGVRLYFQHINNSLIFPTVDNHTFFIDLPDLSSPANPFRVRLDKSLLQLGTYVYGILQKDENGNITLESNRTLVNYTLHNMLTKCQFWNESAEKWETTGCAVSNETSKETIVCLCNHLTSFGADFVVAPNPINFAALGSKLANLKDNLAVLLTIVSLIILYVVGIIACRKQDKKDVLKWSIGLLMDNKITDEYFYQITIQTGSRRDAETSSKIFFVVNGEEDQSELRILASNGNMMFDRGSEKKFLMSVDRPLGSLNFIKIWHDNSGKNSLASWYLDHIVVTDLLTQKSYFFMCDDWLAVDQSDGNIERVLPVASQNQISQFSRIFSTTARKDFSDGHLWFSLFSRPTKSCFTRVQRLTCAIAILFSTMLVSAMFYGREDDEDGQNGVFEIGPIRMSVKQVIISIQASLIVVPVNVLLVQLFRRARSKHKEELEDHGIGALISRSDQTLGSRLDNDSKKNENGFQFPHWAVYIAWGLAVVIVLVSGTFVFLYSVDWGAEKSNEWLLSIFLSFFQSILLIQPAKVIVTAVVISFFIKRCAKDKEAYMVDQIKVDHDDNDREVIKKNEEEWLFQTPLHDEIEELKKQHTGLDANELNEARKKRRQHTLMIATIHDIISYLFYIILLTTAVNTTKDIQAYRFHQSVSDVFLKKGKPLFQQIRTPLDFWSWCDTGLIAGLHASSWYNNKRITWLQSRFISNRETFVVGPARIRQLRVTYDVCEAEYLSPLTLRDCIDDYDILSQETRDFLPGWKEKPKNSTEIKWPWSFQSFLDLDGFPYNGIKDLYDGGGYAVTLGNTASSSRKKLNELKQNNWIDRHTAAIFIEFTVYNANVNLFGSVVFLLERSVNGAFFPHPVISPLRLYDFIDGKGTFLIVIYVLFVIVVGYNLIKFCSIHEQSRLYHNCYALLHHKEHNFAIQPFVFAHENSYAVETLITLVVNASILGHQQTFKIKKTNDLLTLGLVVVILFADDVIIKNVRKEKKNFFKQFWNVIDFCVMLLSLLAIAMYGGRTIYANSTMNKITADTYKETFVNFQYIVLWNDLFRYSSAFTVFFASIKICKLLHFNRRIRLLAKTLKFALKPILFFTFMFFIYFTAFIFLSYIWFEQKLYVFSTIFLATEELFSMLLGRFDFTRLKLADPFLGPFFFIAFTLLLTLTLLNMFIGILDESIKKARAEMEEQENEFEVMEYITKLIGNKFYSYVPKALLAKTEDVTDEQEDEGPQYIVHADDALMLRVQFLFDYVSKMEEEYFYEISERKLEEEFAEINCSLLSLKSSKFDES